MSSDQPELRSSAVPPAEEVAPSTRGSASDASHAGGSSVPSSSHEEGLASHMPGRMRTALRESGVFAQALQEVLGEIGRTAEVGTKVEALSPPPP